MKSSTKTKGTWATRFLFASESYRPNVFLDVFKRWWVHGFWAMLFSSRSRMQLFHRDHIRTACLSLSVYHSLSLWFLLKTHSKLKPKLYPYLTILSTCQLFSLSLSAVNTLALAVEMYLHCNSIVFLIFIYLF